MKTRVLSAVLAVILIIGVCSPLLAANPILPLDNFIPDVEARVFTNAQGEERLYLYGSMDEYPPSGWCSWSYKVFSAPLTDLDDWTDHGVSFASRPGEGYNYNGIDDGIPWSDERLYAPDVLEAGGRYWLVSCMSNGGLGMSVSDTPEGPFSPATRIAYESGVTLPSIDPALYFEDDVMYLLWGQMKGWGEGLVGVVLEKDDDDIYSIAIESTKTFPFGDGPDNPDKGFGFYEGPSIRKIGDLYYILYPSNRGTGQHMMSYATADHPLGPYTLRGDILDNEGIDYIQGNNHGSLLEVNGQWYIFYHRGAHGNNSRRVSVEPITINADGTIDQVPMTNHGFGGPLNPYERVEAAYQTGLRLNGFAAGCYLHMVEPGLHVLKETKNNSCVEYRDFDFGDSGALRFHAEILPKSGGSIELVLDDPNAAPIGVLEVPAGGGSTFEYIETGAQPITGVHTLYLRFKASHGGEIGDLASFYFSEADELFSDNFSGGLQQWKNIRNASVTGGVLKVRDNTDMMTRSGAAWTDYSLEVALSTYSGSAGITFRKADENNYYLLTMRQDSLRLSRFVGGAETEIRRVTGSYAQGAHIIRVDCAGNQITVSVDGAEALRATDSMISAGGVGFSQESGSETACLGVTVTPLGTVRRDTISINGTLLEAFREDVFAYTYPQRSDTIPVVTAESTDPDVTVEVEQAPASYGEAKVTFRQGADERVYTIQFVDVSDTYSDLFDGEAYGDFWEIMNPAPQDVSYEPGVGITIRTETFAGDLDSSTPPPNLFLQPAEGDWSFEVVIDMPASYSDWGQAGIVIYDSPANCIKLVYMNGTLEGKHFQGGGSSNQFLYAQNNRLTDLLHLRANKLGDEYTFAYSTDGGQSFTTLAPVTFTSNNVNVGFAALKGTAASAPIDVTFKQFVFNGVGAGDVVPVERVEIDGGDIEVVLGKTGMAEAVVYPANASFRDIVWEIEQDGEVIELLNAPRSEIALFRGLRQGTATLRAVSYYDGAISGECTVTVLADATALWALIAECERADLDDSAFKAALAHAQDVAASSGSQAEIDSAYNELSQAYFAALGVESDMANVTARGLGIENHTNKDVLTVDIGVEQDSAFEEFLVLKDGVQVLRYDQDDIWSSTFARFAVSQVVSITSEIVLDDTDSDDADNDGAAAPQDDDPQAEPREEPEEHDPDPQDDDPSDDPSDDPDTDLTDDQPANAEAAASVANVPQLNAAFIGIYNGYRFDLDFTQPGFGDGSYRIIARTSDGAGALSVHVDTVAPVIQYSNGRVTITEENLWKVLVDGAEVWSANGVFSVNTRSNHTIVAEDKAGNTTTLQTTASGGSSSSSGGGRGGSGGGGGGGGGAWTPPAAPASFGETTTTAPTPAPVSQAAALEAVNTALSAGSATATARLQNPGEISLETMQAMLARAGSVALRIHADSMSGGAVDVRLYVDPAQASGGLNLAASTINARAQQAQSVFAGVFSNKLMAVSLEQDGAFGQTVEVALKLTPDLLAADELVLYGYNRADNTYIRLGDQQYRIDESGYLHFRTAVGGDFVISAGILTAK